MSLSFAIIEEDTARPDESLLNIHIYLFIYLHGQMQLVEIRKLQWTPVAVSLFLLTRLQLTLECGW